MDPAELSNPPNEQRSGGRSTGRPFARRFARDRSAQCRSRAHASRGPSLALAILLAVAGWLTLAAPWTQATPLSAGSTSAATSPKYLVRSTLNVRVGSSTAAPRMGRVFASEKVEVLCQDLGTSVRGSRLWDFIQYDVTGTKGLKKRGWVSDYYISTGTTGRLPGVRFGGCPAPLRTPGPAISRPAPTKPGPARPLPDRTCSGGGNWMDGDILVHHSSQIEGGIRITFKPTKKARALGASRIFHSRIVGDMWRRITACVELTGDVQKSVWQQLDCHVVFGVIAPKTGPTYDLESWHRPLEKPSRVEYIRTQCLNKS